MIETTFQPAVVPGLAQRASVKRPPSNPQVQNWRRVWRGWFTINGGGNNHAPTEVQRKLAANKLSQRLVGPPPSFQANVLEIESDIDYAIQQLEVKRETVRNAGAIAPRNQALGSELPRPDADAPVRAETPELPDPTETEPKT